MSSRRSRNHLIADKLFRILIMLDAGTALVPSTSTSIRAAGSERTEPTASWLFNVGDTIQVVGSSTYSAANDYGY